jgi:cell division protein FtsB
MREFQVKNRVRRILYSKGMVILLIILFLYMMNATWNMFKKASESAANLATATNELNRLKSREDVLSTEIERLSTDPGIEAEIRNKFSVSKPGEKLLIIVDDKPTTTPEVAKPESWWTKFKKFFR